MKHTDHYFLLVGILYLQSLYHSSDDVNITVKMAAAEQNIFHSFFKINLGFLGEKICVQSVSTEFTLLIWFNPKIRSESESAFLIMFGIQTMIEKKTADTELPLHLGEEAGDGRCQIRQTGRMLHECLDDSMKTNVLFQTVLTCNLTKKKLLISNLLHNHLKSWTACASCIWAV